jgi:hypothetical protein
MELELYNLVYVVLARHTVEWKREEMRWRRECDSGAKVSYWLRETA